MLSQNKPPTNPKNRVQSTLINSTMHNSMLSHTSTWRPGPGIFTYILLYILTLKQTDILCVCQFIPDSLKMGTVGGGGEAGVCPI